MEGRCPVSQTNTILVVDLPFVVSDKASLGGPQMVSATWSPLAPILVFLTAQIVALSVFFYKRKQERQKIIKLLIIEIDSILQMGGETKCPLQFSNFVKGLSIEQLNAYAMVSQGNPPFFSGVLA